jgi:hypothetical protein
MPPSCTTRGFLGGGSCDDSGNRCLPAENPSWKLRAPHSHALQYKLAPILIQVETRIKVKKRNCTLQIDKLTSIMQLLWIQGLGLTAGSEYPPQDNAKHTSGSALLIANARLPSLDLNFNDGKSSVCSHCMNHCS